MSKDQRRSGFGPGFSRDMEAILAARQLGLIYDDEARENMRIAGLVLERVAQMPEFTYDPEPEYEAGPDELIDEGDDDE